MPVVLVEQSNALMLKTVVRDNVPVSAVFSSITAVSCANGKLSLLPASPEFNAQELDPTQVVFVPTRYTVLAAGKVIPELPPQSPALVGEVPAATPAIVMSLKSQSLADNVAAVMVRVVPMVSERTKPRACTEEPAQVNVPLTV